jgi:hypothetical protein
MNEEERRKLYEAARRGRELRDDAIDRVEEHAEPGWIDVAVAAVRVLRYRGAEFTTDDVWAYLETEIRPAQEPPREPRAMGAAMRQATRLGLCEATDRTTASNRPGCHRRPVRIWRPKPVEAPRVRTTEMRAR